MRFRRIRLILRGLNDTVTDSERATTLATQMQGLLNQAVDVSNSSLNGQSIFAGYQVNGKAFELVDSSTTLLDYKGNSFTPKVVNYLGDQGTMQRNIGPNQSITLNVHGDQAFDGFLQNLTLANNALMQNDTASLQTILGNLKSSLDTMDQYRTSNGVRLSQVQSATSFLDQVKT